MLVFPVVRILTPDMMSTLRRLVVVVALVLMILGCIFGFVVGFSRLTRTAMFLRLRYLSVVLRTVGTLRLMCLIRRLLWNFVLSMVMMIITVVIGLILSLVRIGLGSWLGLVSVFGNLACRFSRGDLRFFGNRSLWFDV